MLVGVLKQKYLSLKYTHVQINESERSSRRQLEANLLFNSESDCTVFASYEHCTTALIKREVIFMKMKVI